jgi:hypothetical protein
MKLLNTFKISHEAIAVDNERRGKRTIAISALAASIVAAITSFLSSILQS